MLVDAKFMKKVFGYMLIVFGGIFLFSLIVTSISEGLNETESLPLLILVIISLLFIGTGLFLIKKSKRSNKIINSKEIYFKDLIELEFQLTFKAYLQGLLISFPILNVFFVLIPVSGVLQLLSPWVFEKLDVGFEKKIDVFSLEYLTDKWPFIFMTLLPFILIFIINKQFKKNDVLNRPILYMFKDSTVTIKGNKFESKLSLERIYKIKFSNNYLFLFFQKQASSIIPKRVFKTKNELKEFIIAFDINKV